MFFFTQIRKTKAVSVFPVAFSGGLTFEGPICKDGKAVDWQAVWQSKERFMLYTTVTPFCIIMTRCDTYSPHSGEPRGGGGTYSDSCFM